MEEDHGAVTSDVTRSRNLRGSSLEDLYVRHAPEGIRLAYLLTGDRSLADDLVQDAFLRVAGRLAHLRDPDAFGAYLRRTIVNLHRGLGRRRKVERAYLQRIAGAPAQASNENDELDAALHEALLRLPERQRAAVVLRFYEDLSDAQTAEVLRCARGTVRALVARGMKSLRADLEGMPR